MDVLAEDEKLLASVAFRVLKVKVEALPFLLCGWISLTGARSLARSHVAMFLTNLFVFSVVSSLALTVSFVLVRATAAGRLLPLLR